MGAAPRELDSAAGTAEELAEQALRWVLRGGTWSGLAREVAWQAARATGVEHGCLDWLTGLVEARLAERVDGLEFVIDRVCDDARAAHLRAWPHDRPGGETAAILEGHEQGVLALSRLYVEVLEWASDLLSQRLRCESRAAERHRSPAPRQTRAPANVEPPARVADALLGPRDRFGWPSRRTA